MVGSAGAGFASSTSDFAGTTDGSGADDGPAGAAACIPPPLVCPGSAGTVVWFRSAVSAASWRVSVGGVAGGLAEVGATVAGGFGEGKGPASIGAADNRVPLLGSAAAGGGDGASADPPLAAADNQPSGGTLESRVSEMVSSATIMVVTAATAATAT